MKPTSCAICGTQIWASESLIWKAKAREITLLCCDCRTRYYPAPPAAAGQGQLTEVPPKAEKAS